MWCYRTVAGWIENVMNKDVLENIMGKKPEDCTKEAGAVNLDVAC